MRARSIRYFVVAAVLSVLMLAVIYVLLPKNNTSNNAVALENQFESNAFTFRYPEGWQYQIPQTNMLFLTSPEVLAQNAGATITIQRSIALSAQSDSLEAALNLYLERGPLRSDRAWEQIGAAETIQLDDYSALRTTVEGSEQANTLTMRSVITILQAESNFFFIFTTTAPLDDWDSQAATFEAIINSVDILE